MLQALSQQIYISNHGIRRTNQTTTSSSVPTPYCARCVACPPEQPPAPPEQQVQDPVQPAQVQVQPGQPPLNWSYFKPEFSGKLDEDAEGHLLRTNNWMETHNFPEVAKVQRFCLTLTGEARSWYESLKPIVVDWLGLQD